MADDFLDDIPMVYGLDARTGELRHVDQVPNGGACGCVCPDPSCGQKLIARNNGKIKMHHFAHTAGTCSWAVENAIAALVLSVLRERGRAWFPSLGFWNPNTQTYESIAEGRVLSISGADLAELESRSAPGVRIEIAGSEEMGHFLIVPVLSHELTECQLAEVKEQYRGVLVLELRDWAMDIRESEGKHYNREELMAEIQSRGLMERLLAGRFRKYVRWAHNKKSRAAEAIERRKYQERVNEERKRREELERSREERRRQREERLAAARKAEKARLAAYEAETARIRAEREQEGLRRLALAEEERQKEAIERAREIMMPLVENPTRPARGIGGTRWYRCVACGTVGPETEFAIGDIDGRINWGICRQCDDASLLMADD